MKYINNNLKIEGHNLQKLAKKFGTPLYCYSYKKLKQNIDNFKLNFKTISPLICFATKANSNLKILKEIKKNGLGADVVSKGELMKALKAGISAKKIVFSGVGKTSDELSYAIDKKILLINSESKSEVKEIERIAKSKSRTVDIGIRFNPNTDANTLKQISTGKKENKFGVNEKTFLEIYKLIKKSKNINIKCLSVHIGSQITNHTPYERMLKVIEKIIKKSKLNFDYIDLGGGMGISYEKNTKKLNYQKYSALINNFVKKYKSKVIFEPGRSIVGDTAILLTKILYIKKTKNINFIILDSAMNDLMRPALYNAEHKIIPIKRNKINAKRAYEFVGPICESTDKFATIKKFQKLNEKELVAICDVGAYGTSLSSNYNLRPKPQEIMIKNSKIIIINKRQKLSELM